MKKQLLIVAHHMTIGGVQKTLISALKALDYEKYDVTLYLRKNRTDLLPYVDERVKVIVNKDPHHYYRKPYAVAAQLEIAFNKLLRKNKKVSAIETELADKIREDSMRYEQKTYFNSKKYDKAIAYFQGYTALFVDKYVNSDEKIIFYHTSSDDMHSLHESGLTGFNKIASLHEEQALLLAEWYPQHAQKIRIVENYTDTEMISAQSKEFDAPPAAPKTVLCSCGRFASVKGFDLAVEAAKTLKEKGFQFLWYFVGDGAERQRIEALIEKYNLVGDIEITGMQKNPYPYMAACDIYVQPSYEEALGLTMLEAHRLNKPVVTTATVGGAKLVKSNENGIVCEINSEALANSIENLINNKNLYSHMKQTLEKTDYSHEFKKYQEQWKALLEE